MKERGIIYLTAGVVALLALPTYGTITSVQHSLIDGQPDTAYNATTGVFTVAKTNANVLSVNEDGTKVTGTVSNAAVSLVTYFDSYDSVNKIGKFKGGSYMLTFDFDDGGGGGAVSYQLSGSIAGMQFKVTQVLAGPISKIEGQGLWKAIVKDLPGIAGPHTGVWNDGGLRSSINSMTLAFNYDLTNYNYQDFSVTDGRIETQYQLWPSPVAVPEASTVVLLAAGAMGLIRRRRA